MTTPILPLFRAASFCITLSLLSFTAAAVEKQAPYPSNGGLAEKIQPFVDKNIIPGAVLLVADKEKILDVETVGSADVEKKVPMVADNLIMLCSVTKTLTGAVLMMLVDEGKVSLDDPVEKYLPAFKGQMVDDKKNPPHAPQHPITVREIMCHTAGLSGKPHREDYTSVTTQANALGKLPLQWEPGSKYQYSAGPLVGGAVIEAVTGMNYADVMQQRLFGPLGMKETSFWPTAEQAAHLPICAKLNPDTKQLENVHLNDEIISNPSKYAPVPRQLMLQCNLDFVQFYKNRSCRPDGGLFSTALDMAKFGQMLLNGGTYEGKRYLSEAALKALSADQTGGRFVDAKAGYGVGAFMQKADENNGRSVGSFGHHGARKPIFWIDPAQGLVMVFMTQVWDLDGKDQENLYSTFFKSAIEKYGKAKP